MHDIYTQKYAHTVYRQKLHHKTSFENLRKGNVHYDAPGMFTQSLHTLNSLKHERYLLHVLYDEITTHIHGHTQMDALNVTYSHTVKHATHTFTHVCTVPHTTISSQLLCGMNVTSVAGFQISWMKQVHMHYTSVPLSSRRIVPCSIKTHQSGLLPDLRPPDDDDNTTTHINWLSVCIQICCLYSLSICV